ncbi:MAG TPA: hypothetical protein V6D34_14350 [Candidatus Sericytochromatia bacterium]
MLNEVVDKRENRSILASSSCTHNTANVGNCSGHYLATSHNELQSTAYVDAMCNELIRGVDAGFILAGSYSAIMIGEGHDFQPAGLNLAPQRVNSTTHALLLLYNKVKMY